MTAAPGVVVVGSLTADLTATCRQLPAPGETVIGTGFELVAGGKGCNQALAVARMGTPTWLVGRVGDDPFAAIVTDAVSAAGIDDEYVLTTQGTRTGVAHIRVDARGENDIVMVPLANAELRPADIDVALDGLAGRVRVLLVQLEIPIETAVYALTRARADGLVTVLDPAPAAQLPGEAWRLVDVVTPNETEATRLTGIDVRDTASAEAAGHALVERGCGAALITLGEAGAVYVTADQDPVHIAAHRVAAVDTTAAGDAFAGVLGSRLAAGESTVTAATWASAAGALATTVLGASSSIPRLQDVQQLIDAAASTHEKGA